jgi:predicted MFS family arabinose efflux permease
MLIAVVIFTIGSAIQCSAQNIPMLFAGRAVAGLAIGQLTQIVPLFISEVILTLEILGMKCV